jgi:hypothetical protein
LEFIDVVYRQRTTPSSDWLATTADGFAQGIFIAVAECRTDQMDK